MNDKLPMSDFEIQREYRTAKDPELQIGILAELNDCDEAAIRSILGLASGATVLRRPYKPWPPELEARVTVLISNGLGWAKIGEMVHMSPQAVYKHFRRKKIREEKEKVKEWE